MSSAGRVAFARGIGIASMAALMAAWTPGIGASAGDGADWPGFRGVRADGVSAETGVFAAAGVRLEIGWKRSLGKGYSGMYAVGLSVPEHLRFVTIIPLVIVGYMVVNVFFLTYFVRVFSAQTGDVRPVTALAAPRCSDIE